MEILFCNWLLPKQIVKKIAKSKPWMEGHDENSDQKLNAVIQDQPYISLL